MHDVWFRSILNGILELQISCGITIKIAYNLKILGSNTMQPPTGSHTRLPCGTPVFYNELVVCLSRLTSQVASMQKSKLTLSGRE